MKLNILLACDAKIPFLDIYLREIKAYVHKKIQISMFRGALFIIAQTGKLKCPSTGNDGKYL